MGTVAFAVQGPDQMGDLVIEIFYKKIVNVFSLV